MSESERRFQRYDLNPGAFSRQRVKVSGFIGSLKGWKDCRVKDMSTAGALVLTKQVFLLGDHVEVELTTVEGIRLVFSGEVVNLSKDHSTDESKLGISLGKTAPASSEGIFLSGLSSRFRQSL
jgi:hypothetical protein